MPEYREATTKLLCFCTFHNGLYELMFELIHMKWNVYHNCVVQNVYATLQYNLSH
ncbi:hypothetical protein OESDEN_18544 [Oesophagostomum dentatum]|uniref:Uncharacterized protein n=1 Tax=Oesophagostomum dentatum TaxID=61180 RepID=A0A0B1S8Z9_OESDE|nr:hypothetical protein OESDEN_18544 [Oesophagostomum dentatum]